MTRLMLVMILVTVGLASVALPSRAAATTLLSETFDGSLTAWTLTGTASQVTTPIISGKAIKLPLKSTIGRIVSTVGYGTITVTVNLAASSLEIGGSWTDRCHVEYSTNKGQSYNLVLSLLSGQDTSAYFSATLVLPAAANNNPNFMIRYRASGNLASDYCYAETTTITGVAASFTPPTAPIMATTYDTLSGSGAVTRTLLTFAQMTGTGQIAGPIDYSAYALPANAAQPTNYFQAPLETLNQASVGSLTVIVDLYSYASDPERSKVPKLYAPLLSHGSHLIPVNRGYQLPEHPFWEWVVQPGRCWNENGDSGWTRCSFDFALKQKNSNCVHNGKAMFLYKTAANGVDVQSISRMQYQISGETCEYFAANMWGTLDVAAVTTTVETATAVRAAFEAEIAAQLPVKDISQLAVDFPGTTVATIASELTASRVTGFGVTVNGVLYRGGFNTRHGVHPTPQWVVLPSYSTAKVIIDAMSALRYQQKYPTDNPWTKTIASLVSEAVASGKWNDVTIENAFDMATGNYGVATFEGDEGSTAMSNDYFLRETKRALGALIGEMQKRVLSPDELEFTMEEMEVDILRLKEDIRELQDIVNILVATGQNSTQKRAIELSQKRTVIGEKLNFMINKYARKATPGTTWNYHTPDHNLGAVAMNRLIQAKEGITLSQFLVNEIYAPLKLSPLIFNLGRTYTSLASGNAPQEWGAYGALYTIDDAAKIAIFMNENEGKINGVQTLHYGHLKQAEQRDATNTGLAVTVPGNALPHRYNDAFWAQDSYNGLYNEAACTNNYDVYMSGFGGIGIVLIKSKVNYLFWSDNDEFGMQNTLLELAAHVRAPCATAYSP